jgi:hypothetical protein
MTVELVRSRESDGNDSGSGGADGVPGRRGNAVATSSALGVVGLSLVRFASSPADDFSSQTLGILRQSRRLAMGTHKTMRREDRQYCRTGYDEGGTYVRIPRTSTQFEFQFVSGEVGGGGKIWDWRVRAGNGGVARLTYKSFPLSSQIPKVQQSPSAASFLPSVRNFPPRSDAVVTRQVLLAVCITRVSGKALHAHQVEVIGKLGVWDNVSVSVSACKCTYKLTSEVRVLARYIVFGINHARIQPIGYIICSRSSQTDFMCWNIETDRDEECELE